MQKSIRTTDEPAQAGFALGSRGPQEQSSNGKMLKRR